MLTAATRKEKDIGGCVGAAAGMLREEREGGGLRGDRKGKRKRGFGERERG